MTVDLVAARKEAIARGDKALGREIYHQLILQGYAPEDIDADTFAPPKQEKAVKAPPEKR